MPATQASRAAQISEIIQKRQPLVQQISRVEANLRSLAAALRQLEQQRSQLLQKVTDPEVKQRLQDLNFLRVESEIDTEIGALSKLKARFGRSTINIGVVGKAKQGKSRLLQSITGLSAREIPDGDYSHCTGVRSTIYHKNTEEPTGAIWFHTETSLLNEVIAEYYDELNLGTLPRSMHDFAHNPLPPLPDTESALKQAMYEHLQQKYHNNFEKYGSLLNQPSPKTISKDQIREYVAQDSPDGHTRYFNFLAVREAHITCQFPNLDVGQIALIDMPGLGDTGVGDDKRMVAILEKDVDVVLFVRMGKPLGDFVGVEDVALYDRAKSALKELPIHLWSFMVLNRTSAESPMGDNSRACQALREGLPNSHIEIADCITVNCSDRTEVDRFLLERVLQYLASEITKLDRKYATACQDRLSRLQQVINAELGKAQVVLGSGSRSDAWFPLFQRLFNEYWENLTVELQRLLSELRGQRDVQDSDFKEQVKAALQECQKDAGIPSLEEIETRRIMEASYGIAYHKFMHEIRAHLSQHFLKLDNGLKRSLDQTKASAAKVLIEKGRLGSLTEARGAQFLYEVADQISEDQAQIKFGFQVLSNFELSYRGLIQHRIRKHLDRLTPDVSKLELSKNPSDQEILQNLKVLYEEAIYHCEEALEEVLAEPSQAAYAIVEEFVDRVLRAKGAKDEWQRFLEEVRSEVWAPEFEQFGERTRIRRQWLDVVEKAINANQPEAMQFLVAGHE